MSKIEGAVAVAKERWGDLAAEIISITATPENSMDEMVEKISVLLDSVHTVGLHKGAREGIEIGVKAACNTTDIILDMLRPPHARP
jgi:hypothetical protein